VIGPQARLMERLVRETEGRAAVETDAEQRVVLQELVSVPPFD
jgi:hypothetical protein